MKTVTLSKVLQRRQGEFEALELEVEKEFPNIHPEFPAPNLTHIGRNLLCEMQYLPLGMSNGRQTWSEVRHEFVESLAALKTYLELLTKFPDFREKEYAAPHGYLGRLTTPAGANSHVHYVREAEKALKRGN